MSTPALTPILVVPKRGFGAFVADAVLEERHEDTLVITEHPVEQGAVITDHAYKMPATLDATYVWSAGSHQNSTQDVTFLQTLYQQLLQLQANRTILQVFTSKRVYNNMLAEVFGVDTDKTTENALRVRVAFREIITVTTQLVQIPDQASMLFPQNTAPYQNLGLQQLAPAPNFNFTVAPPGGF